MRAVFADTWYWVALANRCDQWHEVARSASRSIGADRIVTTDEILAEFLNFFADAGSRLRRKAVQLARAVLSHPTIEVLAQTHHSFLLGLELYQHRHDKDYSLTDCISMQVMKARGLTDVLTGDRHFVQEGFSILLTG